MSGGPPASGGSGPPEAPPSTEYWDKKTQDRWFFGFLAGSTVAVAILFAPYLYVLLFAVVAATVTWPVFGWILARVGSERRTVAAGLTMALLFLVVFGPLITLGYLFVQEAGTFVADSQRFLEEGRLDALVAELRMAEPASLASARAWVEQWVPPELLPGNQDILSAAATWANQALGTVVRWVGQQLPAIVNGAVGFGLDAVIFLFSLFTLYLEGPRVLRAVQRLSPMDDRYEAQLFEVFRELANNMVIATLVTAAIQGAVAAVGYAIVGLGSIVFLGILSGVGSFVPLVGTAFVWVPAAVYVAATRGIGWGIFVAVWNLLFTGSVDNIVKPLFLRGNTRIHPLLIFLAVFGGLVRFGVPGALVGPLIVAFFLAAYTIYVREYLGEEVAGDDGGLLPAWLVRRLPFLARWGRGGSGSAAAGEEAEEVGAIGPSGGRGPGDPAEGGPG